MQRRSVGSQICHFSQFWSLLQKPSRVTQAFDVSLQSCHFSQSTEVKHLPGSGMHLLADTLQYCQDSQSNWSWQVPGLGTHTCRSALQTSVSGLQSESVSQKPARGLQVPFAAMSHA